MTNKTATKLNRRIFEETNEVGLNGKAVLAPTKEFMPAQERTWVEFTVPDGRRCGAWLSAGQAVNVEKWMKRGKRHYDPDKKLWI